MKNIFLLSVSLIFFAFATPIEEDLVFRLHKGTTVEINTVATPETGMLVYNTDDSKVYYHDDTNWVATANSNIYTSNGQLTGSREVDLNSHNLGFLNGNIGMGDATPDATLDVAGSFRLDGIFYDKDGDAGTYGQILSSTATGTDWIDATTAVPYITVSEQAMQPSTTKTFTITGYNFIPTSVATIPGFDGTIDSVNIISPTEIEITITSGPAEADYDIVITNNGVSNTSWTGNGDNLLHVLTETLYLFAITDSYHCAESLPYGSSHITEASNAYFSTEHKNISHNKMRQVFTVGGVEQYTITYNYITTKTLENRLNDAVASGEDVNWVVNQGGTIYNYGPHKWWYSNAASVSGKWNSSGTRWSNDDGSWGAAPNDVQGNNGPYETWGHGNHNSNDNTCQNYYTNGTSASSSAIKSYMYMVVP